MDTLAAFALCSEAPHKGLLARQPVPRDAPIITPFMWLSIAVLGVFIIPRRDFSSSGTGILGGTTEAEIGTVFFAAFIFAAVANGFNCRAMDGKMPEFFKGNPTFLFGNGRDCAHPGRHSSSFGGAVFGTGTACSGNLAYLLPRQHLSRFSSSGSCSGWHTTDTSTG